MGSSNETEFLTERDTVKRLKHLGKMLLRNNATVDKILELLDKLELELSMLNQSPTEPIQESLVSSMKALISDELLRTTDEDVKISVTSCIAEITRITAPDTPYDDDHMKEIFKLMVSAFDKLSDISGRCYEKALAIIDNVAKVRLCLVMLDLECDDLVIQMFRHFLQVIRSNHPQNAIDSMESIMTLVLDESEEVSLDLLKPLLDSVRKDNETITPVSRTLAEKVVTNCAIKLKPYLMRAVESSGRALDEYAQIVASICQSGSESPRHDHLSDSNKAVVEAVENGLDGPKDVDEQLTDVTKGLEEPDITCLSGARNMDDTKLNIDSANDSKRDDQTIKKSGSKRKLRSDLTKNSKSSNAKANSETGILESGGELESETQFDTVPKKRGRKPNSLMNAEEGYDHSWIHAGKKTGKPALSKKNGNSNSPLPPSEKRTTRKDNLKLKPKTVSKDLVSQPEKEIPAKPSRSRKTRDISCDLSQYENAASGQENVTSKLKDTSERHEALVSNPKTVEYTNGGATSNHVNILDGSSPKRGRPRKRNGSGNKDVHPKSVSKTKEVNLNPRIEVTSSDSPGVRVKEEPDVRKDPEVRPHGTIRKIKFTLNGNRKTAGTGVPESIVAVIESNAACEYEQKPKLDINVEAENANKGKSSAQKEAKKRRKRNATPSKDLNKSSATKAQNTKSASKTLSGAEETPQPWLRRRCTTVKVEPSETHDLDNSLIGCRIKVWWPMDKTYYEGVVVSYDPVRGKHKISYADGEEEILNLKKQRWVIVTADVSPAEEQGLALHKLAEASDIAEKINEKSELEPAKVANGNSKSRRSRACAGTSNSESAKSAAKSADTSALDRSGLNDESKEDPLKIVEQPEPAAAKPKARRTKAGPVNRKKRPKNDDLVKEKAQDA